MKILIIYYSFEGNCKFVAEEIKNSVGGDIISLKPKKEPSSKGFSKFIWGGKQVVMNEKPELEPLNINIDEYDVFFIGTPVWAGTFTPAINSFISQNKIKNKKIALFCCSLGGKGRVFERLENNLGTNDYLGELELISPLTKTMPDTKSKIRAWALDCIDGI